MAYPSPKNLVVTISPTPYANPLLVDMVSPSPHRFFIGVPLSTGVTLVGSGGAGPAYNFSILSGALPTGVSLNGTTGALTGTPTVQGAAAFIAQVQDSGSNVFPHSLSMNVEANLFLVIPPDVRPIVLARGTIGTPYRFQFVVEDGAGSTAGVTYSVLSGSLPTGLSLSSGGVISGTPSGSAGTSAFTVRATKTGCGNLDLPCTMTVNAAVAGITFTIPTALRRMTVGVAVSAAIQFGSVGVAYGLGSLVWSISSGSLPAGLTMDSRGNVKGTPTTATTSAYTQPTITVTDAETGAANSYTPTGPNTFNVAPTIAATTIGNVVKIDANGDAQSTLDFSALFFGSGNDGNMVLNGTNTYAAFVKVGNAYTANKHVSANNITITSPGYLVVTAYAIDIADTFDLSGAPAGSVRAPDNSDASGKTAGIGVTAVELGGSSSGITGATGTINTTPTQPTTPANLSNGLSGNANNGGNGGNGTSATGGLGGGPGVTSPFIGTPTKNPFDAMSYPATGAFSGGNAGGAGGGGGGISLGSHAGGDGGGSGAGAPVVQIRARRLKTDGSTAARAFDFAGGDGGNGTNGTATGCGGGGAGSGGVGARARLVFSERIGAAVTNLIDVSGGKGGKGGSSGGGGGVNGVDGKGADSGLIEVIDVGQGLVYFHDVVVAGGTTAGAVNKMTI